MTDPQTQPDSHLDGTALALLDAGIALAEERGLRPAISKFTLSDIAKRAGVSAGSLYQRWPNTEDFLKSIAIYRIDKEDDQISRIGYLLPLVEQGLRGPSLIRAWSAAELEVLCVNNKWHAKLALWPLVEDPEVKEAVRHHYRRFEDLDTSPFRLTVAWQGGRLREGLKIEDLIVLRTAMREGLAFRKAFDPEAVRDDIRTDDLEESDTSWTLLGLAFEALNASFIEAIEDE